MLIVLVAIGFLATMLAYTQPRWDGALAWTVGGVLACLAGLRGGGFDYDEYLIMIDNVRSVGYDDIALRLVMAKDPLFMLIIDGSSLITQDERLIFIIVAALSVATKVAATSLIEGRRTLFIALYGVFMAPGLEFAAIRAGLAIGFALLAISRFGKWRWIWSVFAVGSHASAAPVVAGSVARAYPRLSVLGLVFVVPVGLQLAAIFGQEMARYSIYFGNVGTNFALILPAATFGVLVLLLPAVRQAWDHAHPALRNGMFGAGICVLAAVALSLSFVTVSVRLLEISWPLILLELSILSLVRILGAARVALTGAWLLMAIILCTANVLRDTWVAMLGFGGGN